MRSGAAGVRIFHSGGARRARHARRGAWHVACVRRAHPHAAAFAPPDTMSPAGPLTDDAIAFIREQAFLIVAT
ncbi:putative FMN flavoprotein, partial [Burkholderia sp. TJI49]